MAWVVDRGLRVLIGQVDAAAPDRSHASDGTIGDAAHQGTTSDHNPEDSSDADASGNPDNQVDAADITHDPKHGADMGVMTEAIRGSKDKRVKYVIFNRRIFYGTRDAARRGLTAWKWYAYVESDPHTNHAHISVEDATHDQTQPWTIGIDMTELTAVSLKGLQDFFGTDGVVPTVPWRADAETNKTIKLETWCAEVAAELARHRSALAALMARDPAAVTVNVTKDEIGQAVLDALRSHPLLPED